MNDNNYWYDIKDNDGSISIERKLKEEKKENIYEVEEKHNRNWKPVFFVLPLLVIIPFLLALFFNSSSTNKENKYRTFMIYMVGSDLESTGKIATYDLNDIKGNEIDLENNNVLLMVGGSKKWHNFVNEDEIGLYELTRSGFKKEKTYKLSNMGSEETLSNFLSYVIDNYKSEKYDMVFWNHGLGALGLEDDELFEDFLDIQELDNVFSKTMFTKDKLELVIFNNCMSGNVHIASVMKKYANYMVASEEVMYVGSIINRLDFLNDIKKEDNGYDIGLSYVKKSDESISKANKTKNMNLDTTLSIIDLSKIDEVEKNMNEYFSSLSIENNYKDISRARRKSFTYGDGDYTYDTIDLYTFTDYLNYYLDNTSKVNLQDSIKDAVVYNSSTNSFSNGLSFYFPYYGEDEYVSAHLYVFDKLWNNDYLNFIHEYVDLSVRAKRANRAGGENILLLKNDVKYENNKISIELNNSEKEAYQSANVYIFEKNNDSYKLLLKTDEIDLYDNNLISDDLVFLKSSNNEIISSIKENGLFKVYGLLNDSDVAIKVENNNGYGLINKVFVDSKDKPTGGLIDFDDENISYYSLKYNNLNEVLTDEWNENITRTILNNKINDISFVGNNLNNYYVLVELFDINNDVFYSKLTQIK